MLKHSCLKSNVYYFANPMSIFMEPMQWQIVAFALGIMQEEYCWSLNGKKIGYMLSDRLSFNSTLHWPTMYTSHFTIKKFTL